MGIIVPDTSYEAGDENRVQIKDLHKDITAFKKFLIEVGITLHPASDLSQMLQSAEGIFQKWSSSPEGIISVGTQALIDSVLLVRFGAPTLALRTLPNPKPILQKLIKNFLSYRGKGQSAAKNILWELEVLHLLTKSGIRAELQEPPDIIWHSDSTDSGIACKKIYSPDQVAKRVREAAGQIAKANLDGLIALNVDDLLPGQILEVAHISQANSMLTQFNSIFLEQNQYHFIKHFTRGRIVGVMVSASAVARLEKHTLPIQLVNQKIFWTRPSIAAHKKAQFYFLRSKFGG